MALDLIAGQRADRAGKRHSRGNRGDFAISCVLAAYLACLPLAQAQQQDLSLPSSDISSPQVVHEPTEAVAGEPYPISATVTDDVGVKSVTVYYRTKGAAEYRRAVMRRIGDTDVYMATLTGIAQPELEYYIQATDQAGNTLLRGFEFAPLTVAVKPAPAAPQPTTPATGSAAASDDEGPNWLLIGLGVLVVGALVSGGGGGNGNGNGDTGTIVIGGPLPQEP